ncbi:hypothetical protein BDP27DRAFT_1438654 [Rhodocollybia butyracea]|uniref:DUF6532 domain-containing protein n=1 Tax=Rhodocollybia butyracea TaxID=206335 RepID=A0A9P5TV28_9AGAR|nr:hypothetical protein BDP27DRAFT_1438654 [Rhodocollybia butyracea]
MCPICQSGNVHFLTSSLYEIQRVQDLALPPPLKNTILKAYNGLIGIHYPDVQGGILCLCLRRQLHYGEHDILLNAQPINGTLPHHTLIWFPGAGNSTYIFWTLPQEDDFEAIKGQKLSGAPLGLLSSTLIQQLYTKFMNLFTSSSSPSFANNPEIKLLCPRIRHLFSQLSVPSLYKQATMRWHIAQRMILLVEAQIVCVTFMPFHHYSEMFRLIPRLSETPSPSLTVSHGSNSSHNLWQLRNSILYFIPSDIPLDFTNSLLLQHSHFRRLYRPYLRPDISADSFGTHYFPTAVRSAPTFISFVFSTLLLIVLSFVLISPRSGLGITLVLCTIVPQPKITSYTSNQAIPIIAHFSKLSLSLSLFLILTVLSDTGRLGSVPTSDIPRTILTPIPRSDLGNSLHFTSSPSGTTLVSTPDILPTILILPFGPTSAPLPFRPRLHDPVIHTLRNVIGAITEDPWEVERLYHAGIPVWYYQSLDVESTIKVQAWVKEDDIPLRVPYSWIDFEDASPVGPTVYSGSVEASRDQYQKMAVKCWMIAFPAAIFGADLIHKGVDYTSNPTPSSNRNPGHSNLSHTSTSGPSQLSTSLTRFSSVDSHPRKNQKISRNPPVVKRNKFLEPDSPIMPHAFPRWLKAAETVSHEFKQDELPRCGVNRGYVLPEAAVFANHENEVSWQKYFLTYLKIRRVFIAAIDLLGPIACQRSAKDWRRLVSLELHGSLNSETHESAAKLELCQEMNKVAARMGSSFSVDLTNLSQAAAIWRGYMYSGPLPDNIQREILQEIFEISFKQEFLLLDRYLYRLVPQGEDGELEDEYDASTREDRNLIIQDSLFGHGPPAFNHSNPRLHQDMLYALFRIMMGWTRSGRPMHIKTISDGERLGSTHVCGTGELKDTELKMPSSTSIVQSGKKTRAAVAAAKPGPKTRGAVAKAAVPKAASKAPPKKVDLKAVAIRQKKDAHKKAQQLKDEDIQKRAWAMREAQTIKEDNDAAAADSQVLDGLGDHDLDGHDQTPAPSLDDKDQGGEEDQDLDAPLDEDPDALLFNDAFGYAGSDKEPGHKNDDGESAVGTAQDDVDMDVDSPSNEIQVSSPPSTPLKKPMERIRDHLRSSTSPPSSRSRSSLSYSLVTPPGCCRGGKITEKHFTPRTRRLAILGKKMNRRAMATDQPFPTDKHTYNMDILQDLAHEYKGEGDMLAVFARILTSVDTQQELVQFMGYARSGFFTNCMAKARDWVPSCFGIPGKMKSTEVKELIAWLLKDGHYKYGEVDIQIAPPTVALMITFIEHTLSEYAGGVYRHVEFSDTARARYCFHLSSFNWIANEAPIWSNNFATSLYKLILTQSNKEFLLDVEADDLTEVDVKGLEADAIRDSSPLPSSSPPQSSPRS